MKTIVSFSAPTHLVMRMNEEIQGHRQKSAYICDAITKKMEGGQNTNQVSTRQLIAILHARQDIDEHLRHELERRIQNVG